MTQVGKRGFSTKTQQDGSTRLALLVDDEEVGSRIFRQHDHGGSRSAAADAAIEYGNDWMHGTAKK